MMISGAGIEPAVSTSDTWRSNLIELPWKSSKKEEFMRTQQ